MSSEIPNLQWQQFLTGFSLVHRGRMVALKGVAPDGTHHVLRRGRLEDVHIDVDTVVITLEIGPDHVVSERAVIVKLLAGHDELCLELRQGGALLLQM